MFAAATATLDCPGNFIDTIRNFRDKDHIRTSGKSCAERQPSCPMSHGFNQDDAMMAVCRAVQSVDRFRRNPESRVETERDIGQHDIVINGFRQRDDVQPLFHQAEGILLRASTADADQNIEMISAVVFDNRICHIHELPTDQHTMRFLPAGPKDGAAKSEDSGKGLLIQIHCAVLHQSAKSVTKSNDFHPESLLRCFPYAPKHGIQTRAVSSGGQDTNLFHFQQCLPIRNSLDQFPENTLKVILWKIAGNFLKVESTIQHGVFVEMTSPLLIMFFSAFLFFFPQEFVDLEGFVVDEDGKPVEEVEVKIESTNEQIQLIRSDVSGVFHVAGLKPGNYKFSFNKIGFFHMTSPGFMLEKGEVKITFTINHETELSEQIEVYSSSESINPQDTSHSDILTAREIRDIPVKSTHDLKSSLQILPEVVRDNAGQLHIAGGRPEDAKYLLDGFDIGDPVTGNLSVRINVDSMRAVEVQTGRFDSQHDNAGSGVLSLDTEAGDDHWRGSATNLIPGFSAQKGIHMTSWYPRLALSGPIIKGRAWFSESISIQRTLSLVEDLPRDADSISQWAGDNMVRSQIKLTPGNLLQANFLYNQRNVSNVGLSPISPLSTTRGTRSYRSFFSLKDQLWSGRTFYELGIASDFSHTESLPHGFESYRITPDGPRGNYFETQRQKARRWQAFGTVSMPARRLRGTSHDLHFGINYTETGWSQITQRNSIEVDRADGSLLQETTFFGPTRFHLKHRTVGVFGQDTWRIFTPAYLQFGARVDWDQLIHRFTPSHRIALNILPLKDDKAKLTISWGISLQSTTLSTFGRALDQNRTDVFYDLSPDYPILGPVVSSFNLPQGRLHQPTFITYSIGWEQKAGPKSLLGFSFIHRNGKRGLAYEKAFASELDNEFFLQNNRRDNYQSFQTSFRHSFSDKAGFSANYTRSSARTNQAFDFSLENLISALQQPGPQDWDTPNRFISSGWTPISTGNFLFSYFFEYRTGFPFSIVNERQQVIGTANSKRYSDYAGLNLGIEKRLKLFTRMWAIRLSILNISGHSNPDSVVNNIDSPDFMKFGGGQKRSFNVRLRLIK
jgi:hypothetical protein